MATGAKNPSAPAPAANARQQQQQGQEALFASKHEELLSEARGVAREFGVDVRAVAFRPDGTATAHEFIGAGREEMVKSLVMQAVAKDVSAMGPEELAAHERQLRRLRAIVARDLQAKADKAKGAERASEQQEMAGGAGSDKIKRTD
ncbi:hypothetical protein BS78_01G050800 [Paspalum vaginatum]|nr:hypothetical protein BS78_01G050800 [Paspalum vaginatum]